MSRNNGPIVLEAGGQYKCIGTVRLTPEAEKVVRRLKATREKLNLIVWAPTNDEATHKLCGTLIGPECEYEWTGTGPIYENNQTVRREITPASH